MEDRYDDIQSLNYKPIEDELKIQQFWEQEKIYRFNPRTAKKIYSIDTPPPTVSGKMHIGHAFSFSQMDFIARYKRMSGFELFYPFGTDDNGLATNILVEKTKKVRSSMMKREEFIALCIETLKELRPKYVEDWKRIGTSADFELFYSTIDDHSRKVSQRSFIDLYKRGREYRKESPVLWCTNCQTAIAQVELDDAEKDSFFNDIIFKLLKNDGKEEDLIIATTRPELLPACVAVFVHPEDERFQDNVGMVCRVPLFNQEVPILVDKKVDPSKGTGIVMCCTFGDQTDMEWYLSHNLPLKVVITKDGKMNEQAPGYEGLKIKEARAAVIEDLKNARLLLSQKPIKHAVKTHERCGTDVEILQTTQWFIKCLDMKDQLLEAGKKLNWHPEFMRTRYDNWIHGLQWDWCISRQRHFGVPIPVWYCAKCSEIILPEESELPIDPLQDRPSKRCVCGSAEFIGEKDVLDTWSTSSLTPEIAASLVPQLHDKLSPMDLRPQAHDIITFWLFNTMVKSQLHWHRNPWKNAMISGWALDPKGQKMSKSKGNVIEPQAIITKYGADCLRYWCASSKLGEDLPFQEKDLVTGNRMVNKLWNASKLCLSHLKGYDGTIPKKLMPLDRWALSLLQRAITSCTENFEEFEYSHARMETERYFWQVFCDNYLEMVKDRIYNNANNYDDDAVLSARYTMRTALLSLLKLLAPIMPYITEAVYRLRYSQEENVKSIHISAWPKADNGMIDEEAERAGALLVSVVNVIRKHKSIAQVSLKVPVTELIITCGEEEKKLLLILMPELKAVMSVEKIIFGKGGTQQCEGYDISLNITLGQAERNK
ncbi:MAG TPA: valine--tRNA ligase [Candidatus Nanoarchaeia archaeon]|nr:valine--tRNA ligase [Candidatus Nanoarchaeia archaeon]